MIGLFFSLAIRNIGKIPAFSSGTLHVHIHHERLLHTCLMRRGCYTIHLCPSTSKGQECPRQYQNYGSEVLSPATPAKCSLVGSCEQMSNKWNELALWTCRAEVFWECTGLSEHFLLCKSDARPLNMVSCGSSDHIAHCTTGTCLQSWDIGMYLIVSKKLSILLNYVALISP